MNSDITDVDLQKIREGIEDTIDSQGRGISDREFTWTQEPGMPAKLMNSIVLDKHIILADIPDRTFTTRIHNHPSGGLFPSTEDANAFMAGIQERQQKHNIIAGVVEGKIGGFTVMTYNGTPEMLAEAGRYYAKMCDERRGDMFRHSDRYAHLFIGESMFTEHEQAMVSAEYLERAGVTSRVIPMPGYDTDGWRFVKK
jgi:hypothetical protein